MHPPQLPITEYVAFDVGLTFIVDVLAPVLQEYVQAPGHVILTVFPAQMVVLDGYAEIVGVAVTFTVIVLFDEQPDVVPVAV